jgi:hypothetical protein
LEAAFINPYARVTELRTNRCGIVEPVISSLSQLSQTFGNASLQGLSDATQQIQNDRQLVSIDSAAEKLLFLSEKARNGHFTGLLPNNTETWSKGDEFLRKWPKHLNYTGAK